MIDWVTVKSSWFNDWNFTSPVSVLPLRAMLNDLTLPTMWFTNCSTPTLYQNETKLDKFYFSLQFGRPRGDSQLIPTMSAHQYTNLCLNKDFKQKKTQSGNCTSKLSQTEIYKKKNIYIYKLYAKNYKNLTEFRFFLHSLSIIPSLDKSLIECKAIIVSYY